FCGIFNSFFQFFSALFNLNLQFETHYTFTKYTLVNNLAQLHTEMVLVIKIASENSIADT
ncbi:hypothetical protein, partial [Nostoc sp. ChiSLP03a]|uniref:hypothetical protein n=1 Tax=Nostoc sp. ChiSLP03a TaxID=3075380 RepID=UPI002AD2EA5E